MEMGSGPLLVFSTAPDRETARAIARTLVEEKWAACVSILPGVESHYNWEGRQEQAEEVQLLIKTTGEAWENLRTRLAGLHPYECPEIIAVEMVGVHAPYLDWLKKNAAGAQNI